MITTVQELQPVGFRNSIGYGKSPDLHTYRRSKAAAYLVEGVLTLDQIADRCGVESSTLDRWKLDPKFKTQVEQLRSEQIAAINDRGIANKEERVRRNHERWQKLHQVVDERAQHYLQTLETDQSALEVPGASTGLLVRSEKSIGPSGASKFVEEWQLDSTLLAEMRNLESEVSAELGQRPRESSGANVTVQAVIMMPRPATSAPVVIDLEPTK